MAVKPFADQTLTDAINRAKACELTRNTGVVRISNYANRTTSDTSELVKLVSALTTHVTNLEKKIDETVQNGYRKNNNSNNRNNNNSNNPSGEN